MSRRIARIQLHNGISFTVRENQMPVSIGRDSRNDICIDVGQVSRQHCEVYLIEGELFIRDTSTNGTRVGELQINRASTPIIGRTSLHFANNLQIVIDPLNEDNQGQNRRSEERRAIQRRNEKRRDVAQVVTIDQRADHTRRFAERRQGPRRFGRTLPS